MSYFLLFVLLALGAFVVQWAQGPRQLGDGRYRLKDHDDGLMAGAGSCVALMILIAVNVFVVNHARQIEMDLMGMLVCGGVLLLFDAGALFAIGRQLLEVLRAEAGELIVPSWPLTPGDPIKVNFSRRLRFSGSLDDLQGELVRYHITKRQGKDSLTHREAVERHPLGNGWARLSEGVVQATFELTTPNLPEAPNTLLARLASGGGHDEWHLEVKIRAGDGPVLDSGFKLELGAPRERGRQVA